MDQTNILKARALRLYLEAWPKTNFSSIARQIGRDRSRVSRWAARGLWAELAAQTRLQQEGGPPIGEEDLNRAPGSVDAAEVSGVRGALETSLDRALQALLEGAPDYFEDQASAWAMSSVIEAYRLLKARAARRQVGQPSGLALYQLLVHRQRRAAVVGPQTQNGPLRPAVVGSRPRG